MDEFLLFEGLAYEIVTMNIAFTLCANNYLSQAKVLGDSFLKHHPDFEFVIGLVDEYDKNVDYTFFQGTTIIPVSQIVIPDFAGLEKKYNIIELNTAVKPFYFSYLFLEKKAQKVIYLDPDIMVFSTLSELIILLDSYNIIITPQACTPIDDSFAPIDAHLLGTGVFNLGFIALSNYELVKEFLNWWSDRLMKYSFDAPERNMFYDQLWINLVPAFFDNYFILKHYGYNMAAWNMHERLITYCKDDNIVINGDIPLRFFHYSGYKFTNPETIVRYSNRFTFQTRPDVIEVFKRYHDLVLKSKFLELSTCIPFFCRPKPIVKISPYRKQLRKVKKIVKTILE